MNMDPKKLNEKIIDMLKKAGALKKGHFRLSSGLHSEWYIQCALILQNPENAEFLGKALAEKVKNLDIDVVVSPAVGGIVIGQEVARALRVKAIFAERVEGNFTLRRGFEIHPPENILIVEDVVTTGKSSLEVKDMVESLGCQVVGCAAICDRSHRVHEIARGLSEGLGIKVPIKRDSEEKFNKVYRLLERDFENYEPEECPLCKEKIPIDVPGSRFTPHRKGAR